MADGIEINSFWWYLYQKGVVAKMSLMSRREFFGSIVGGLLATKASATGRSNGIKQYRGRVISIRSRKKTPLTKEELGSMLDRGIVSLTGIKDANEAWCSKFSRDDHVSIKVNCLGGIQMSSNPLITLALVDRLIMCGVRDKNIIIWDRSTRELKESGYPVRIGGNETQCFGTDEVGYYPELFENGSVGSLFSRIMTDYSNKLINVPVLKDHGICGMTFAMKNHFGAINNPNKYHLNKCNPYIPDLNSLDIIRNEETLIVGDATKIQAFGGPSFKGQWAVQHNGILMGDDPVAIDRKGLELLAEERNKLGKPSLESLKLYPDYIRKGQEMKLGEFDNVSYESIIL